VCNMRIEGCRKRGAEVDDWTYAREEVTGRWRKLHNEELHNLYSSLKFISVTQ
jgi:hypothetical protein